MNGAQQFLENLAMSQPCGLACGAPAIPAAIDEPSFTQANHPALEAGFGENTFSIAQIIEMILKDRRRLDRFAELSERKVELASRLLAIALVSFALYGLAMSLTFFAARDWPRLAVPVAWLSGADPHFVTFDAVGQSIVEFAGRLARLVIAYCFGLIAATGVCLPSLYFYGLLSGLRMTMSDVVVHSLKCTAVAAVALIGILPIYLALALGAIVLPVSQETMASILLLGLWLPFIGGLWGTRSLFVGFVDLCHTMPPDFQKQRACFLRRLILSWCGCYLAIAPLMILTVWRSLGT